MFKSTFWICIGILFVWGTLPYTTLDYYSQVRIEDKEKVVAMREDSLESYYLVFTDKKVFKNEDSWAYFKFDSSDLYGKLQEGHCYDLKANWWRNNLFSLYENIITAKEVECSNG